MAPKRSIDELVRERDEIKRQERECGRALRRLRALAKRESMWEDPLFTPFQRDVALAIFVLDGWRPLASVGFLEHVRPCQSDLEVLVESWVAELRIDTLCAMGDARTAHDPEVFKRASEFHFRWRAGEVGLFTPFSRVHPIAA